MKNLIKLLVLALLAGALSFGSASPAAAHSSECVGAQNTQYFPTKVSWGVINDHGASVRCDYTIRITCSNISQSGGGYQVYAYKSMSVYGGYFSVRVVSCPWYSPYRVFGSTVKWYGHNGCTLC